MFKYPELELILSLGARILQVKEECLKMSDVGGKERQLTNCEWLDSIVKFKALFGCRDCMYKDECRSSYW